MTPHVTDTQSPSAVCEVFIDGRKADIGSITLARDGFDPFAPFDVSIKAQITPETPWAREQRKRQELIDFAKTVAPPALVAEGNVSDSAWIDNSPTYSAVEASRERVAAMASAKGTQVEAENFERCVPRRFEQKPWVDPDALPETPCPTLGDLLARAIALRDAKPKRPESLNDFAAECHAANQHWWHDPATGAKLDRNMGEMLMLVVSEIAECMEGERKNLMDDHLPHRKMAEVELADAIIRIMDIAGAKLADLDYHVETVSGDSTERAWSVLNKGEALFHIVQPLQAIRSYDGWTFARKLARAVVRIMAYADRHGYDLWGASTTSTAPITSRKLVSPPTERSSDMRLEDLDRDVAVTLFAFGAGASPCGSRVTCSPAPMNTDRDFLVEVLPESSEGLATALWDLHFVREGDVTYFHDAKGDGFASYRRGDLNLIVTSDAKFAERHRAATHVCTRLNLMHKPDRIALFQAVLYGKKWDD